VPGMMPLTPPPSILRMVISSSSDPFTNIVLPTFFFKYNKNTYNNSNKINTC
jgi:hypothetical protein